MFEVRVLDKQEYKLKLEQIKNLVEEKNYNGAVKIADEINWRKVRSGPTLCMIAGLYEKVGRFEESREIFYMAYDRSPLGRNILCRLTHLAIKMNHVEEAQEYYEEFVKVAPHDNTKYILRYEIARAKGDPLQQQIEILEELKECEYTEEWAFELAYLYHKGGDIQRCIDVCDDLILWFGEGKYVEKASQLKKKCEILGRAKKVIPMPSKNKELPEQKQKEFFQDFQDAQDSQETMENIMKIMGEASNFAQMGITWLPSASANAFTAAKWRLEEASLTSSSERLAT